MARLLVDLAFCSCKIRWITSARAKVDPWNGNAPGITFLSHTLKAFVNDIHYLKVPHPLPFLVPVM